MSCCEPSSNGQGSGGGSTDDGELFTFSFETLDATIVTQTWGQLPNVGAGVLYEGRVEAVQNAGERGQYSFLGGAAGRNASGSDLDSPIQGGNAWVPPGAPWFTLGAPGWTMFLAHRPTLQASDILQIRMAGVVGQVVRWSGWIRRRFIGGATP